MAEIDKETLRQHALAEGFSQVGFARPELPEAMERLQQFVDLERHGQMAWMADRMAWRGDPSALWPEAKSVIMLAEAYTPDDDPMAAIARTDTGAISVYARNRDYHDIVKKRLKRVGRWLIDQAGPDTQIKVFVDTAPVMEKPLGAKAGLGWQGKHTNLVGRDLGSWFFLGAIFTTHNFDPDPAEHDHCGSCTACLSACPTDAFPAPYQIDARRCISYLTIEHHGPVDAELRPLLGNRIYGCDDCLAACPWNKFAVDAADIRYHARADLVSPPLSELVALDDAAFRLRFSGSPIKRIGRNRFVRNVLYAIGNSHQPELRESILPLLSDPDGTVADAAAWALAQF
ncbi:tRNA epoxyqueuosine(34) reductase QueG [Pacificibacter marinus]|uniref:Epoxyqueuosine reductase n=1 Tax=Pacificibacter marinus TaxID=658057 RepID=A0A1Y5THY2_9RHOB|nr:tRNA epoxyqueuosine(34) reductase QueG [Pacificibacter marinus]SEL12295.1 epoxyqueuosine reductase [Pacificibacter marinus]SLN60760.1 Epoxyqueuosine reductase [Pacificibacter marinus]